MSNTPQLNIHNVPPTFETSGKVKGISGAGVSAQFETRGEDVKAQLDDLTLQMALRGIRSVNASSGGPVQSQGRRFG
jgi:hypothetical protein